jgi:hypothetical protein
LAALECGSAVGRGIATVLVFCACLLSAIVAFKYTRRGFSVIGIIFMALLIANVRGTLLSAKWRPDATEPPPVRMTATLADRLADQLPIYVWPVGQWFFCILAFMEIGLLLILLFWPQALFFRIVWCA